jgi:hypothetical protein
MPVRRICLSAALAPVLFAQLQQLKTLTVEKSDGGPVTVAFEPMTVNQHSKLRRTWYAVNDAACPVQLAGAGVRIEPSPGSTYLRFETQVASLLTNRPVVAFELRFVLFDIFGGHMGTIRELHVADVPAAGGFVLKPDRVTIPPLPKKRDNQPLIEERPPGVLEASVADAQKLLHVATFVAQVKSLDGEVWSADLKSVSAELARVLRTGVSEQTLQPTRERK